MDGLGSFQDTSGHNGALDAEALFSAVSVHCERVVDANHISAALVRAVAAARTGGPAVLLLPKDIQQSSVEADAGGLTATDRTSSGMSISASLPGVLGHAIGRVTIVAGKQVARDDARGELEQLRALLNARLATVPDAKDVSGCQDRYALGVTGVMGHLGVAEAITQGSACLSGGNSTTADFEVRPGCRPECCADAVDRVGATLCPEHTRPCPGPAHGARTTTPPRYPFSQAPSPAPAEPARQELTPPAHVGSGVRYRDAMAVLDDVLPDDADVFVDAGNTGAAAIHLLPVRRTGRSSSRSGWAYGLHLRRRHPRRDATRRRTDVIAGDGAFFMHGMEIHTAVEYSFLSPS